MAPDRKRAAIFIALVFVCGFLSGIVGVNLWDRGSVSADGSPSIATEQMIPSTTRKRAVKWFAEELKLGEDQATQVAKILDETRAAYKDHEREIDEIRHEAHNRIRNILSDEQRARFNAILAQRKAQRAKRQQQAKQHRDQ